MKRVLGSTMRLFTLLVVAGALALAAASARAGSVEHAGISENVSPVRTIARIPGRAIGFAQDGDRVAWVCGLGIELMNVRTGKRSAVVSRPAGPCDPSAGGGPVSLALAGERVLVFTAEWSNLAGHFVAYSGSPLTHGLRRVSAGRSDLYKSDVGLDRQMLIAGGGSTLALTSGCDECGGRSIDAKVVVGLRAVRVAHVASAAALAVGGGRLGIVSGQESRTEYALVAWLPDGSIAAIRSGTRVSIAADGRESPLPEPPAEEGVPSPDGSKVALVREIPLDGGGGLSRLSVRDVRTGSKQELGPGYGPAWSPDSRLLLYSRPLEKPGEVESVQIFDGVSSYAIAQGAGGVWSPDGKRIAYSRDDGRELRICDPDGGADRRLLRTAGSEIREVRWSPDGRSLAFSVDSLGARYSPMDIWRIGADGSGRQRLTKEFVNANPLWSPDGKRIAFTSDRNLPDGGTEIFTMDADGRNQRRLSRTEEPAATITTADIATRTLHRTATRGTRFEIALSRRYTAVLGRTLGGSSFVSITEATTGRSLRMVFVPRGAESLSISGSTIVFRVRRAIHVLDAELPNRRPMRVAVAATIPIGLSIAGERIAWLESSATGSRVRALTLEH